MLQPGLTVVARLKGISPQGAAVAAVFAAIITTALPVQVHSLWDLCYPFHQRATQTLFGVALLLKVRVVGKHLLTFVDFQLGVQLLQLVLKFKKKKVLIHNLLQHSLTSDFR